MRQRRAANFDDDDDGLFDPAYPGLKVVRDGGRVRVPLFLTDSGMPDMTSLRRAVFDARNHRPRFADLTDARLQDGLRAAADARAKYIAELQDAWRTPIGGIGGAPHTTAPPADQPDDDDDLSPRDRYIKELQNAYKTPLGQAPGGSANALERAREQWLSPGARPGMGDAARARSTATKDAAADRDAAYAGYVDRISNAWRAR
jgi:hypothetical protein